VNIQDKTTLKRFALYLTQHPSSLQAGSVRYYHTGRRLLLDFDGPAPSYVVLCKRLGQLHLKPLAVCYMRSTHHWHVIVELGEYLTIPECLFAQLFCGSDPPREAWGFIRYHEYRRRDKFVQVLFDKKVTI
jgi:hypothetical protein